MTDEERIWELEEENARLRGFLNTIGSMAEVACDFAKDAVAGRIVSSGD